MQSDMEAHAIDCASFALNEYMQEKEMANYIKKEFDKAYRYARRLLGTIGRASFSCGPPPPSASLSSHFALAMHLQPDMARGHRHKLRLARGPRDQELHLLLPWAEGHLDLQERLRWRAPADSSGGWRVQGGWAGWRRGGRIGRGGGSCPSRAQAPSSPTPTLCACQQRRRARRM